MTDHIVPVSFALFLWWFATGAIIYLDGLPKPTFRWSVTALAGLSVLSLFLIAETKDDLSVRGAYLAFSGGLFVWAFIEMAFYAGYITGPRRRACHPDCRGLLHFWHAVETILYNQMACVIAAALVFAVSANGANQIALWTFLVLWILQVSAKLNVFLGVRNLNEDFLPEHMAYLRRYMSVRPINAFFPFAVTGGTVALVLILMRAHAPGVSDGEAVGLALVATLLGLAILEHWFLILPVPADWLWRWSLGGSRRNALNTSNALAAPQVDALRGDPAADFAVALDDRCDRTALQRLLDGIANGAFGNITRLSGVARSDAGFVQFFAAPGTSEMTPYAEIAANTEPPHCGARAFGTNLDQLRLQAAFNACRQRRIAT
ncbi:MAG: putative photosynthetic complex assembly protein PuhE [Pseudomonadota bacterium]